MCIRCANYPEHLAAFREAAPKAETPADPRMVMAIYRHRRNESAINAETEEYRRMHNLQPVTREEVLSTLKKFFGINYAEAA